MFIEFYNEDGSITIRSNGYDPEFVAQLAVHLAYLTQAFAPATSCLNLSLESIKHLDELLTHRKKESPSWPDALVMSTVAYCGEVLRTQVGGEWFLYVCPADNEGGERYFPAIQRAEGKELDFVGIVENEFMRSTTFDLYSCLFDIIRPEIPVQQWKNHSLKNHLFPPVEKARPLRKIFPAN